MAHLREAVVVKKNDDINVSWIRVGRGKGAIDPHFGAESCFDQPRQKDTQTAKKLDPLTCPASVAQTEVFKIIDSDWVNPRRKQG